MERAWSPLHCHGNVIVDVLMEFCDEQLYISISSIIYLPSGARGVVAQSPEPGAHDKSD